MPASTAPLPKTLRRAVFLDRDGVINRPIVRDGKPYPPTLVEEFEILPGVAQACQDLHAAGFLLVVATNQPDIGRGLQRLEVVEEMHRRMCAALPLDRVEMCAHSGRGEVCGCRKPACGMLNRAAESLGIDLFRSFMVGDRWRDVDCGRAAGCTVIFIDRGYSEPLRQAPDFTVQDLPQAAALILSA